MKMGKTLEDIENAAQICVINTGKISFPYINGILSGNNGKTKQNSNPKYHDFPEREYDYDEILSQLRKKQRK